MKNLLKVIFSFFMFVNIVLGGEVTGAGKEIETILVKNGLSTAKLKSLGLKLGEVTGAGKIHIDTLEMIVTSKKVISMNDIVHTEFKNPSAGQTVSEVEYFDTSLEVIKKAQIKAFIIR
ncbi:hypothetical protein [Bacteriovorax sp. Seq25_V]|uniref:hypothetical protein n=1 Tax=Bacteriovorax sp. Seq25_V TaxID=1201288 RepID=UPI00038A0B7F|nr:hypothetical protein [Bacteriovorax sp. Seq25_V]EQC43748.1 hypothetical protein M900_1180 [Bacteriovorax sp. Seq25_V]